MDGIWGDAKEKRAGELGLSLSSVSFREWGGTNESLSEVSLCPLYPWAKTLSSLRGWPCGWGTGRGLPPPHTSAEPTAAERLIIRALCLVVVGWLLTACAGLLRAVPAPWQEPVVSSHEQEPWMPLPCSGVAHARELGNYKESARPS